MCEYVSSGQCIVETSPRFVWGRVGEVATRLSAAAAAERPAQERNSAGRRRRHPHEAPAGQQASYASVLPAGGVKKPTVLWFRAAAHMQVERDHTTVLLQHSKHCFCTKTLLK